MIIFHSQISNCLSIYLLSIYLLSINLSPDDMMESENVKVYPPFDEVGNGIAEAVAQSNAFTVIIENTFQKLKKNFSKYDALAAISLKVLLSSISVYGIYISRYRCILNQNPFFDIVNISGWTCYLLWYKLAVILRNSCKIKNASTCCLR